MPGVFKWTITRRGPVIANVIFTEIKAKRLKKKKSYEMFCNYIRTQRAGNVGPSSFQRSRTNQLLGANQRCFRWRHTRFGNE